MTDSTALNPARGSTSMGWRELWLKEDWWAIWLGLGIVLTGVMLFANGTSLKWVAVTPPKWSTVDQLTTHFAANAPRYLAQLLLWLAVFGVALTTLGHKAREFLPSFLFLYLLSIVTFTFSQWDRAAAYNLEAPLVALALGLAIANIGGLPRWMDAGFRVEFYIKTGIVLLGATLPFTLIMYAGPVAIFQASVVSITTFLVIYFVAKRLGLDRRFAATLGVGGAVCGVSAAIAIAGAVGAKKEHASVAITCVIVWAVVMIFFLPFASHSLGLSAGVAGAWIGTSEFADAAGLAAAQAYGSMIESEPGAITGSADQALFAFTLMKVVGRDVWIGIWALILAIVATTRWEKTPGQGSTDAMQIWWRFPKFVIGFLIASLIVTAISANDSYADFTKTVTPELITPIKDLRTWAFIFCFFSIGLTTRLRELSGVGRAPMAAFTAGVIVNVILGYILSTMIFESHWSNLTR